MPRRIIRRTRRYRNRRRSGGRRLRGAIRKTMLSMSETKYNIVGNTLTIRNNVSLTSFFDSITTGVGNRNRIGNQIKSKRISFRYYWQFVLGTNGSKIGWLRVSLIYPRKAIGGQSEINGLVAGFSFDSFFDPGYWIVMYDKVHSCQTRDPANGSGGNPSLGFIRKSFPFKGTLNYDNNSIDREPLLIVQSSFDDTETSSFSVRLYTRSSFKDV